MERPMTVSIAKVYFVDEKAHREWAVMTEVVVFVANMHVVHIQLDAIKEARQKANSDWLFELSLLLLLLTKFLHPSVSLSLFGRLGLLGLFSLIPLFLLALLFFLPFLLPYSLMHGCNIGQWIIAVIMSINIPSVVLDNHTVERGNIGIG